ncbi:hypothetical protein BDV18DRAFT_65426 [Aspergillus unguis]
MPRVMLLSRLGQARVHSIVRLASLSFLQRLACSCNVQVCPQFPLAVVKSSHSRLGAQSHKRKRHSALVHRQHGSERRHLSNITMGDRLSNSSKSVVSCSTLSWISRGSPEQTPLESIITRPPLAEDTDSSKSSILCQTRTV